MAVLPLAVLAMLACRTAGRAMKIGNTPAEVRDFLGEPPKQQPVEYGLETRAIFKAERLVLGRICPVCNATNGLCISETGLPASGPHPGRESMPIATGTRSLYGLETR